MRDRYIVVEKFLIENNKQSFCKAADANGVKYFIGDMYEIMRALMYNHKNILNHDIYFYGGIEGQSLIPDNQSQITWNNYTQLYLNNQWDKSCFLNGEFELVMLGELSLKYLRDNDVAQINDTDAIFIKSLSGAKVITGVTFDFPQYQDAFEAMLTEWKQTLPSDTLVLCAKCKDVRDEIRCVVHNGKVVTASQYATRFGKWCLFYEEYNDIEKFQNMNLKKLSTDDWFTVDFAMVDGSWKVVETNSFWAAGLYGCSWDKIFKEFAIST